MELKILKMSKKQLNKQFLYQMSQNQQLKISKYQENLLAQAIDSKVSFNQIDTPGWTSMVNTLKSSVIQKDRTANEILITNDYFTGKDISNIEYSKNKQEKIVRSDIRLYSQNEHKKPLQVFINGSKLNETRNQQKSMKLSERIQLRLKNHFFQSQNSSSVFLSEAEHISAKFISKKTQMSKQNSLMNLKNQKKQKRFKEITVYQHLYQSSKRLQNKRAIESILDEKIQNKYVTTFQPAINLNSTKIFQQRANKACNKQKDDSMHNVSMNLSISRQIKQLVVHPNKSNHQEQATKRLFDFLSASGQAVTQKSINSVLEQIPLPCVRYLQKLIFKILSGKNYSFPDFSAALEDKKLVCNKKSLLNIYSRSKQTATPKQNSIAQK